MGRIVPIASGKGGVGKSLVASNLGVALARKGKTVILVDLDLGASNLHTFLGVLNRNPGIGSIHLKQERNLSALLTETGEERLWLIPGDNLVPGVANLDWPTKKRILKELRGLPADFVILDLGSGASWNTVDFWLSSPDAIIVMVPEITSVLNAYSFMKTAAFRVLSRSFPNKTDERHELDAFIAAKHEGSGSSFLEFARDEAQKYPDKGKEALAALAALRPCVVVNRATQRKDADGGYRLRDISSKNLGISLSFGAFLPEDPNVPQSVASRKAIVATQPKSPFSIAISAFAARLADSPQPSADSNPSPLADFDLENLADETLEFIQ